MNILASAAAKAESKSADLQRRAQTGDRVAPWLFLVVTATLAGIRGATALTTTVLGHPNVRRLRAQTEAGDAFVSWILVILAVIAIGLIVVAAVTGWFNSRVGELGN